MMTREEWQIQMMILTHEETGAEHYNASLHALEAHDAAQRAVIEQYQVQLAGCLTAAEGATMDPAKQGDYGWSPAYQATLELRLKCEQQAKEIAELRQYDARTIAVAKTTSSTVSNLLLAGPLTPQQIAVGKDVEIRRLAKENQALREALQRIVDLLGGDASCRLDHHGHCQEHFLTDPCEVKQAQQALKEVP